jgi:hypothetical protein
MARLNYSLKFWMKLADYDCNDPDQKEITVPPPHFNPDDVTPSQLHKGGVVRGYKWLNIGVGL